MKKTTKSFISALNKLNKMQRLAVDTIEGPVMLVAGPGTGKTQTLAIRIANILVSTDTSPRNVLALTFTDSGARAMKSRLSKMIGAEAYEVEISTFHSFCLKLIRDYPDVFTLNTSIEPLSDLEKLKIIYSLLDSLNLDKLRPTNSPYHYAKDIISAISDLKREGVTEDEFRKLLIEEQLYLGSTDADDLKKKEKTDRQKNLAKNFELLKIYEAYNTRLKEQMIFDFDDLIETVLEALSSNSDFLLSCQEQYLYILVDEYQDSNSAQNELVLKLASYWGANANIFVTGDPDQSILRFQGASLENQLSFLDIFPSAKVITLEENYRSTKDILDAAHSLITHNNERITSVVKDSGGVLHSQIPSSQKLNLGILSSSTAECIYIAQDIKTKLSSGVNACDIAIIYHNNKDAKNLADTLIKYGIDYVIQGGSDILSDPTIINFLNILETVLRIRDSVDDELLFTIMHYEIFGIEPHDILLLARYAGRARLSLYDCLSDTDILSTLKLQSHDSISDFLHKIHNWARLDSQSTFTTFFETVLNQSGYLSWVLGLSDAHHRLARINTLFDEIKRMVHSDHSLNLKRFFDNITIMKENGVRLEESKYGVSNNAITLTTAHKSKGLEWEHVYIYKAVDKTWGNNKRPQKIKLPDTLLKYTRMDSVDKNEEERRLFYVALTRAKSSLTITYSNSYADYGKSKDTIPSLFLAEIDEDYFAKVYTKSIEEYAHSHLETILTQNPNISISQSEEALLQEQIDNFELSSTTLNAYLECAYKFKLDKLIRVPHAKLPHLAFGTAIHKALERLLQKLKDENALPSLDFLTTEFDKAIEAEVITKDDLKHFRVKGHKLLSAYYAFNQSSFKPPLATEKNLVAYIESESGKDPITIKGKLDKLEWESEEDKTVKVIDYKTGGTKTYGQIKGETQDSDGDLLRQLQFYKLLLDEDKSISYRFGSGVLDFVEEPMVKGKSGERALHVTDDEVKELKALIFDVVEKIRSYQFPRTTNHKNCENCYFRMHCYPEGIPIA